MDRRLRFVVDKEGLGARVTDAGLAAILALAGGDMRKVLNVLQATASGFETVDAATVYACTGNPTPADVKAVMHELLNAPLAGAHAAVLALTRRGFALTDVLGQVAARAAALALPPDALKLIVTRLADIEYRLAFGTTDKVQGAALAGAFAAMRELLDEAKAGK